MRTLQALLLATVTLATVGCATRSEKLLRSQIEELDRARASGQITTTEYLKQKHELETKAADRDAGLGLW